MAICKKTKTDLLKFLGGIEYYVSPITGGSPTVYSDRNIYLGLMCAGDTTGEYAIEDDGTTWHCGKEVQNTDGNGYERVCISYRPKDSQSGVSIPAGWQKLIVVDPSAQTDPRLKNKGAIFTSECVKTTWIPEGKSITHFALFETQTGGNPYAWGLIKNEAGEPAPITSVAVGQIPTIRVDNLNMIIEDN